MSEEVKPKRKRTPLISLHQMYQGRNTKCTPKLIDEMVEAIGMALPITKCCDLVGISDVTHRTWLEKGQEYLDNGGDPNHEIYGEYLLRVKRALAEWQLTVLREELNGPAYRPGWAKSMTMLERRDRDNWGRHEKKNTEEQGKPLPDEAFL